MAIRVYLPIGTVEYARLNNLTTRQARARIQRMPGAVKIGSRWQAPILANDYAKLKGIKPESARKRKAATRATSPQSAGAQFDAKLRDAVFRRLSGFAATRTYYVPATIRERLEHASPEQLTRLQRLDAAQWHLACYAVFDGDQYAGDDWMGDDDEPILGYK